MNIQIHFHCLLLCICNDHAIWNLKVFNVNMNIIVAVLFRNFSFVRKNTHRPFFLPDQSHGRERHGSSSGFPILGEPLCPSARSHDLVT